MTAIFPPLSVSVGSPPEFTSRQLERQLDIAVCWIRRLAERLRAAGGANALDPELQRFLDACDPVAAGTIIVRLDGLVNQKQQTEAVRLFRELFAATWDQAFDLYAAWPSCDHTSKLLWVQAGELHKLTAAFTHPNQE
jgi:hypothetical protein